MCSYYVTRRHWGFWIKIFSIVVLLWNHARQRVLQCEPLINDSENTIMTNKLMTEGQASGLAEQVQKCSPAAKWAALVDDEPIPIDRKSTRLNSSHLGISYAV